MNIFGFSSGKMKLGEFPWRALPFYRAKHHVWVKDQHIATLRREGLRNFGNSHGFLVVFGWPLVIEDMENGPCIDDV